MNVIPFMILITLVFIFQIGAETWCSKFEVSFWPAFCKLAPMGAICLPILWIGWRGLYVDTGSVWKVGLYSVPCVQIAAMIGTYCASAEKWYLFSEVINRQRELPNEWQILALLINVVAAFVCKMGN